MEKIEGIYSGKDGKGVVKTRFSRDAPEVDIPLEELFEDLEGEGVRIKIEKSTPIGKGIYDDENWEKGLGTTIDPKYKHASAEAVEKFNDMKFGMMVHWGLYSQLGIPESWPANAKMCDREFLDVYYTLWQVFNPLDFNGDEWAELAQKAGMQFFQLTTKHHDGFCMFDTKTKTMARKRIVTRHGPGVGTVVDEEMHFSIMDTLYKHDIIGEVIAAFRKKGLGIGLYFSHIDWNDPNFRWDRANRSHDPNYSEKTHPDQWKAFIAREKEQLREIFTNYGQLDQIFFDGTWFGLAQKEMLDIVMMCRKLQPHCLLNNRGIGAYGDFTSPERWIPSDPGDPRTQGFKNWQVCDPIHTSWAYLPLDQYKPVETLLHNFVDAVAKGGTYVFAISPQPNGRFPQKTVETLEWMGRWLKVNGEAIYATRTYKKFVENDKIYYTRSKDNKTVYAIHFGWPYLKVELTDVMPRKDGKIKMLGIDKELPWQVDKTGKKLTIEIPKELNCKIPCECAYTLKIEI